MEKKFNSTVLYYAGWNSFTHVGGAYNLAKVMPDTLFHVVTAEKWPFSPLPNLIYHHLYRPNCAMRFDEKIYLHTYSYEKELGDVRKYRKHIFSYIELLKKIDPNLVISDITLEVALWAKFLGYPTCVFYETLETNNLRHKIVWDNAESILVRYPKRLIEQIEPNIHSKMFFAGGVSKFDLIDELPTKEESKKIIGLKNGQQLVTFLASSHSHNNVQVKKYFRTICEALDKMPENVKCCVLYPTKDSLSFSLKRRYKKLNFIIGVFNQVHHYLGLSDVVVTAAGMGATMESAYFRAPMLLVPAPWIINEQMIKAEALEKIGAARLINPVTMTAETIEHELKLLLNNPELREKIKEKERILIDKKGYTRLARHITKMLNSSYCVNKSSILND